MQGGWQPTSPWNPIAYYNTDLWYSVSLDSGPSLSAKDINRAYGHSLLKAALFLRRLRRGGVPFSFPQITNPGCQLSELKCINFWRSYGQFGPIIFSHAGFGCCCCYGQFVSRHCKVLTVLVIGFKWPCTLS